MIKLICILAAAIVAVYSVDPVKVDNGPIGSSSAGHTGRDSYAASSNAKKIPKQAQHSVGGSGVRGTVDGKSQGATASGGNAKANDGGKSTSGTSSGGNHNAEGKGKSAGSVNTGQNTKTQAGGRTVDTKKTGKTTHEGSVGGVKFEGENVGKEGNAAKCTGGRKCGEYSQRQSKVGRNKGVSQVSNGGTKILSVSENGSNKETSKTVIRKTVYGADTTKGGRSVNTKITSGRTEISNTKAEKKAKASVADKKGRASLIQAEATKFKEEPCDYFDKKENKWDENILVKNSMKVVPTEKTGNTYNFPQCMLVSADINVPSGLTIEDLAGSVIMAIPNCGTYSCGEDRHCFGRKCFLDSFCPSENDRAKLGRKTDDTYTYLMGQAVATKGCEAGGSGRQKIEYLYCPDVNGGVDKGRGRSCSNIAVKDDNTKFKDAQIDIHFYIYQKLDKCMKGANQRGSDSSCKFCDATSTRAEGNKRLRLRGCRVTKVDYALFGTGAVNIKNIKGFGTVAGLLGKNKDKTLGIQGAGGILGSLLGGGGRNIFGGGR